MVIALRAVRVAGVVALLVGLAVPAAGQDLPRLELGVAFQGGRSGEIDVDAFAPNGVVVTPAASYPGVYKYGFAADLAVPINARWSVLGEIGWVRNTIDEFPEASHANFNALSYGGGLRWQRPRERATSLFAQVVIGVQYDRLDTGSGRALARFVGQGYAHNSLQVQPGVGVVIPIAGQIGAVAQVDYRRVFSDPGANLVRYLVGVRYADR